MFAKDESIRSERVDGSATVDVAAENGHPAQDVGGSPQTNYGETKGSYSPILQ